MTFGWMTFGWMTFGWMTFGWMTFGWLTFGWLTFDWLTFGWLTFGWLTFGQLTFCQLTFGQLTFGQLTFGQLTFGQLTFDRLDLVDWHFVIFCQERSGEWWSLIDTIFNCTSRYIYRTEPLWNHQTALHSLSLNKLNAKESSSVYKGQRYKHFTIVSYSRKSLN
jgi:hypothetical protein